MWLIKFLGALEDEVVSIYGESPTRDFTPLLSSLAQSRKHHFFSLHLFQVPLFPSLTLSLSHRLSLLTFSHTPTIALHRRMINFLPLSPFPLSVFLCVRVSERLGKKRVAAGGTETRGPGSGRQKKAGPRTRFSSKNTESYTSVRHTVISIGIRIDW